MTTTISNLEFDDQSKSDQLLKAIIENVIKPHVIYEIDEYDKSNKSSKATFHWVIISMIVFSSLLPFLIYLCQDENDRWIPILVSAISTILTSANYIYNLKNQWETHMHGFINQKGSLKEWELYIMSIKFSNKTEDEKIADYFKNTGTFLKKFNKYELDEIKGYFIKLREDLDDKNDAITGSENKNDTTNDTNAKSGIENATGLPTKNE